MARRKYVKDYKLVHSVDEKGKVRTRAEYAGDRFCFVQEREAIRRHYAPRNVSLDPAAAACGLAWLCYIGSLLLNTGAMRCFYISMPYVFTALPLWKLSTSVVTILTVEEPMHRRHSHQVSMHYPPAALWTGALPAVSLAGIAITAALGKGSFVTHDLFFSLLGAAIVACAAFCFARRKVFATKKLEKETN